MQIKATYRRLKSNGPWHFCNNCTQWPSQGFVEEKNPKEPPVGGFCPECITKLKDRDCIGWSDSD